MWDPKLREVMHQVPSSHMKAWRDHRVHGWLRFYLTCGVNIVIEAQSAHIALFLASFVKIEMWKQTKF